MPDGHTDSRQYDADAQEPKGVYAMLNEKLNGESFDGFISGNGPVIVDFWAPWCGPCRAMAPMIEELAQKYEGRITVGKVNVDDERQLAQKYRIFSIPTILLFVDGEIMKRITGLVPMDELTAAVDELL